MASLTRFERRVWWLWLEARRQQQQRPQPSPSQQLMSSCRTQVWMKISLDEMSWQCTRRMHHFCFHQPMPIPPQTNNRHIPSVAAPAAGLGGEERPLLGLHRWAIGSTPSVAGSTSGSDLSSDCRAAWYMPDCKHSGWASHQVGPSEGASVRALKWCVVLRSPFGPRMFCPPSLHGCGQDVGAHPLAVLVASNGGVCQVPRGFVQT